MFMYNILKPKLRPIITPPQGITVRKILPRGTQKVNLTETCQLALNSITKRFLNQ